jgi:hypothetical protein
LHALDNQTLLLVGGFAWKQEAAADFDSDDDEALGRTSELGFDDDDFLEMDDDADDMSGSAQSLQDPLWLYSTNDSVWIPLQVHFKSSALKEAIIRCSAALSNDPTNLTILAQSSADEPGALIWLSLKQKTIQDEAEYAKIDSRKIPAASPRLMFDHPIFYDFAIQLGYEKR